MSNSLCFVSHVLQSGILTTSQSGGGLQEALFPRCHAVECNYRYLPSERHCAQDEFVVHRLSSEDKQFKVFKYS